MQDAGRHAVDFQHVEIAIGVERVARVVGGDADRNAARLHFMQQRHATPARGRAVLPPVLQIKIAHRQRHHGNAGARHLVQRIEHVEIGLVRQRTAMPDQNFSLEAVPQGSLCDLLEGNGGDIVGFVGMEVKIEAVLDRRREDAVEQLLEVGHHIGHRAQNSARCGHPLHQIAEPGCIAHRLDTKQACCL